MFDCIFLQKMVFSDSWGWSGGAMVLGKLPVPGRPTIWITVGQGPTALAAGAGGGCLDIFTLIYPFSPLSPSLWETARYRLKYCLKGLLNPKQPTNQVTVAYSINFRTMPLTLQLPETKIAEFANSVDLNGDNEPPHQGLHCWPCSL